MERKALWTPRWRITRERSISIRKTRASISAAAGSACAPVSLTTRSTTLPKPSGFVPICRWATSTAPAPRRGGDLDAALEDLDETVRWAPDDPGPYSFRSQILVSLGRLDDALHDLNRIVELAPENPMGYYQRAALWAARGDHLRRFTDLDTAQRLAPDWPDVCNALAWLLATCSDASLRNGTRAVELARHALHNLPEPHAEYLDTLAAAFAEAGDFPQAISFAHQAIDLADDPDRQLAYNEHLACFEVRRPWREPERFDDVLS